MAAAALIAVKAMATVAAIKCLETALCRLNVVFIRLFRG